MPSDRSNSRMLAQFGQNSIGLGIVCSFLWTSHSLSEAIVHSRERRYWSVIVVLLSV